MKKTISLAVSALFLVAFMSGIVLSAEKEAAEKEQTIMVAGTINDANQLVSSDGKVFDVADTAEGKELLTHAGQKVQVTGTVMDSEGKELISVSSFEVMKE